MQHGTSSQIYLFTSIMCLYKTIYTHNFIYEEVEGPPYIILPGAPHISGPALAKASDSGSSGEDDSGVELPAATAPNRSDQRDV
jgi:hypothetical protein